MPQKLLRFSARQVSHDKSGSDWRNARVIEVKSEIPGAETKFSAEQTMANLACETHVPFSS